MCVKNQNRQRKTNTVKVIIFNHLFLFIDFDSLDLNVLFVQYIKQNKDLKKSSYPNNILDQIQIFKYEM